ncbi:MAG: chemotaxis protein CheW [Desulfatiglandales bacterium]
MGLDQEKALDQLKGGKYLTFSLGEEEYGINVLKIKEIIGMMPITSVPRTPEFVKGVANLRGKIIPVIDLRLKLGLEARAYDDMTCIIVVEVQRSSGSIKMGIVVDKVSEVMSISVDQIEDTPTFGVKLETQYMLGMAKTGDQINILIDIDRVVSAEDIAALDEVV